MRNTILLAFLVAVLPHVCLSENVFSENREQFFASNPALAVMDSLARTGNNEQLNSAISDFSSELKATEEAVYLGFIRTYLLVIESDVDRGSLLLDSLLVLSENLPKGHFVHADLLYLKGEFSSLKGEILESIKHHEESLSRRNQESDLEKAWSVLSLNRLGRIYRYQLYDALNAKEYYTRSLEINLELYGSIHASVADNYYNLTTVYRILGDFEKAEAHGLLSLDIHQKLETTSVQRLANSNFILANVYFQKYDYTLAEKYCLRAIEILKKENPDDCLFGLYYNTMGSVNQGHEEYDEAKEFYLKALEISKKCYGPTSKRVSNQYLNLGIMYTRMEMYPEASKYLHKALELRASESNYGEKHSETSRSRRFIAKMHLQKEDFDSALYYYHQALISLIKDFNKSDLLSYPEPSQLFDSYELLRLLKSKAKILKRFYEQLGESQYLVSAIAHYDLADEVISANRRLFQYEGSKLFVSYYNKETYELAIESASYARNDSIEQGNARIFRYMSRAKSQVLIEYLSRAKEYNHGKSPKETIGISAKLKGSLNVINRQIAKLKGDSLQWKKLEELQNKKTVYIKKLDSLTSMIEKVRMDYPGYSLADVVSFARENQKTILQYLWADSTRQLYRMDITPDTVHFASTDLTEVSKKVDEFLKLLKRPFPDQEHFNNYAKIAHELYQILIPEGINTPEVVVIADGPLSRLPFEALTTDMKVESFVNYKALPYLIRDFLISYNPSVEFLLKEENIKEKAPKVLALSYSEKLDTYEESGMKRDTLVNIPGTAREIANISQLFPGTFLYGQDAEKAAFLESVENHNIIHLALHGSANLDNPSNSTLIFGKDKSKPNNMLYSYEIPSIDLGSKLVVLSACETGVGAEVRGEGVYSLSRSLLMAGAHATISSLWKVDDKSSADLMTFFYEELETGKPVGVALRNAKLKFIESANEFNANPAEWASFVFVGNGEVSYTESRNINWYWILILLTSPLLFWKRLRYSRTTSSA